MGAKTWMLVYADGAPRDVLKRRPELDRAASLALAGKLFPSEARRALEDTTLSSACPPDDELLVGCFDGVTIVAAHEFALDHPSKLPARFVDPTLGSTLYLHAMHSVVDWFAYAVWRDGRLERSLSVSPDDGVLEDIGPRAAFEVPYWDARHPATDADEAPDSYPLPFHPLELGEAALLACFGYQIEGFIDESQLDPEEVPLMRFKRSALAAAGRARPWWRPW